MTVTIQEGQELEAAKVAFDRIFQAQRSDAPLDIWIREDAEMQVGVLVPEDYVLEDETFRAVATAVTETYIEHAYNLCLVEAPVGAPIHYRADWADGPIFDLPNVPILRNCIYSPQARWGIYLSEVEVALIAGSADFFAAVAANLGRTFDEQLERLVDHARDVFGRRPPSYLLPLLSRLEGPTFARRRVDAAGFLSAADS